MSAKQNTQDRKEFETFTRYFIYKSIQIIVQSRLGDKIITKSNPSATRLDWFNLAINDNIDVHTEAKKIIAGQQNLLGQNVCTEISLRTTEGDSMVLELWYISLDTNQFDPDANINYTVYNRMGIALKSVFSVSRVTPAYKLARRQRACAGDYVICYRVYLGEPNFYFLGDGYEKSKVGSAPSPYGTLNVNVAYRTKLLISPQKTGKEVSFVVKDDHFKPEGSESQASPPKPCYVGHRRSSTSELDTQLSGAELCSTSPSQKGDKTPVHLSKPIRIPGDSLVPQKEDYRPKSAPEKQGDFRDFHKVGAFAQLPNKPLLKKEVDDIPFLTLLQQTYQNTADIQSKVIKPVSSKGAIGMESTNTDSTNSAESESNKSTSSHTSAPEDFVMVELKTPFYGADANSDLGKFYRECQTVPALTMFEEDPSITEALDEITTQLEVFESSMNEFDDFVTSLHQDAE
ncbi:hypothetical protein CHS0354_023587 [Potamilus streckersoni]|uniref:Autophagy-related protein 13 n=1 Tax=Potamilus streckersoni TaxID=2493646 RepID=A0AAE0SM94_9BIVA|nr:hypothetical protein CHS0354_023587 [Potamilus streckersoni]